tara:strand:+ start:34 stop:390 length:357 start_codon:yes stop_codon:yes gene_type:complete
MNWNEAQTLMESARDKSKGKPIANNTRLYDNDGYYTIRLHNNVIMEIYPDYTKLYDGGWSTVTTKARLNQFSPINVYQRDFVWYINGYQVLQLCGYEVEQQCNHGDIPFVNGMVIPNE